MCTCGGVCIANKSKTPRVLRVHNKSMQRSSLEDVANAHQTLFKGFVLFEGIDIQICCRCLLHVSSKSITLELLFSAVCLYARQFHPPSGWPQCAYRVATRETTNSMCIRLSFEYLAVTPTPTHGLCCTPTHTHLTQRYTNAV